MCSFTALMHRRRKNYFFHRKFLFLYFSCQMGEWNSLEYRRVALYYYFVCIRDTKTVSAASRNSQPHPTNDFNNYKRIAHCMRTNKHLICIHVQTRFELIRKVFFPIVAACLSLILHAPTKPKVKKWKEFLLITHTVVCRDARPSIRNWRFLNNVAGHYTAPSRFSLPFIYSNFAVAYNHGISTWLCINNAAWHISIYI